MSENNPKIEKSFTYPIPNEWRSTEFTAGKTGTWTYKGPRFLTFEIDKETGKESGWCIWEERDLERPTPINMVRVTIDCTLNDENALICEIGNDCGDVCAVDFRTNREWKILHQAPEGYNHTWCTDEVEPRDIYDEFSITYDLETQKFNLPVKGWENEGQTDVTWDEVKQLRNKMLIDSDGNISEDMPEEIKQEWRTYRQRLRDLPAALAEFPAFQAGKMFPTPPNPLPQGTNPDGDPRTSRLG